ncbi:MAG: response regulator [Marinilabiliales bacterium]|nr:response regulator [Marinilabiliales bacterium]
MVIDDNDHLRKIICEALTLEGFLVFSANDGVMGLEKALTIKPDLILSDILMPGLDGFSVKKKLAEDVNTMIIPFIFLTAVAEQDELRKGMSVYGADDYLIKPVTMEEIINSIKVRLEKSASISSIIAEKLNQLKNKIITVLPHELITPLQGILGFSSILHEDDGSLTRAEIKEMARIIEESGKRLYTLIENYLQYSKFIIDKESVTIVSADLEILDLVKMITSRIAERYHRLNDLQLDCIDVKINIEKDDFEYILRELIDNAFKFSEIGTPVKVTIGSSEDFLIVKIEDEGIGFPFEKLSEVGAFNQFDRNIYEQQGSGLGLITSMLIVRRYHGLVDISNNTHGTTVAISLPFYKLSEQQIMNFVSSPSKLSPQVSSE